MIFNAQEIGITRTCDAQNCPEDAQPGWPLCDRHDNMLRRGIIVTLHVMPDNLPDTLRCSNCGEHKADDDFARARDNPHRRKRHQECRECSRKRRDVRTRTRTPAQKARNAELTRARRARNAVATINQSQAQPVVETLPSDQCGTLPA